MSEKINNKNPNNFLYYDEKSIMSTSNTYPHFVDYDMTVEKEVIDFNKEKVNDILAGNGFVVEPSQSIKKDLKAENGVFSPKFGQTLSDVNPFIERYKCSPNCPKPLTGRINYGITCPTCGHKVRYVDDNYNFFGWIVLNEPYCIIHPSIYKKLESFFGKGVSVQGEKKNKIDNMLDVDPERAIFNTGEASPYDDEPFFGIGMIAFVERFDEIMKYYLQKKPAKQEYYDDIMSNREKVFINNIPVITTLLRPFDTRDNTMSYEPTNAMYTMMNKLATDINKNNSQLQRTPKVKNHKLNNLQKKLMELYAEQENIISGKRGDIRTLLGGRYNFSSRCVIVQNPDLRADEVTLPAVALTVILEHRIKNILCRLHNMSPADAHDEWYKATISPTHKINTIIKSIIDDFKHKGMPGLPVIINRNPTISYGSILQMFCIGFTDSYTMSVPLQPLPLLVADFDGDVLNVLIPINQTFIKMCWQKFNPRNTMYISRNDGYFNSDMSMQKDTLINANGLARLGNTSYTSEEIANIQHAFEMKKLAIESFYANNSN